MAKKGRKVTFHGSFSTKAAAKRKESQASNRFILKRRVKGQGQRYIVVSGRKG